MLWTWYGIPVGATLNCLVEFEIWVVVSSFHNDPWPVREAREHGKVRERQTIAHGSIISLSFNLLDNFIISPIAESGFHLRVGSRRGRSDEKDGRGRDGSPDRRSDH